MKKILALTPHEDRVLSACLDFLKQYMPQPTQARFVLADDGAILFRSLPSKDDYIEAVDAQFRQRWISWARWMQRGLSDKAGNDLEMMFAHLTVLSISAIQREGVSPDALTFRQLAVSANHVDDRAGYAFDVSDVLMRVLPFPK